jgi:hypothetical protein
MVTITSLQEAFQVYDKSLPVSTPARIRGHSQGRHAHRLLRWSRTTFLEAVTYVVSRGDHIRCLLRWSCTPYLEAVTYVVSRVKLVPVLAKCVVKCFIMAAILPFAFEVVRECFLGQARMHICVHLYTYACTCVRGYRYGSRYVHVKRVVNGFSMAAILLFAFLLLFNLINQISTLDFLWGG